MSEQPSPAETATATPPAQPPASARGARLAVLLALLALGGGATLGFELWQRQQTLSARLDAIERDLSAQAAQHATLVGKNMLDERLRDLRQTLEGPQQDHSQRIQTLEAELTRLHHELASLRALADGDERLWRLGEIERLLSAAHIQQRLLDDPATARRLLEEADRSAARLGSEALPLREAIQRAAADLNTAPLDIEGLALRLTQLAAQLPELPRADAATDADATPAGQDWWARTKAWVSGWLHIQRLPSTPNERAAPLDTAVTALLQARRAVLARDNAQALALVRQAMEMASAGLDAHDPRVRAALETLHDLSATLARPNPASVDLTPAFTALRVLRRSQGTPLEGND